MNSPLLNNLLSLTAFDIVKTFLIIGLIMYSFFAAVIVKQTQVMEESLEDEFNGLITLFAWVHLVGAISLIVVAILL
jgi:hypothetical protein